MPILQTGISAFSERVPKVLSPKTHAIADYITVGGLVLTGALLWKRNRKAAIGAFVCGGAQAANTLLSDSPGGLTAAISLSRHEKIEMGLAATVSSLPNFLRFSDEPEGRLFRYMGVGMTIVAAMSDFHPRPARLRHLRRIV